MASDPSGIVLLARGAEDLDLLEQAYQEVLVPSFTSDELPPWEHLRGELAEAAIAVGRADGRIESVAVVEHDQGEPIALLSHLAVRPGQRGTGTGSAMLAFLRARWLDDGVPIVLGEVHDPRSWAETPTERPADRLQFYARQGAGLLAVPWVQPRLWEGGHRVPGMLLLAMGGDGRSSVPSAWLDAWMTDYYVACEGPQVATDATLQALRARFHVVDPVPVGAIDDYRSVPLLADR